MKGGPISPPPPSGEDYEAAAASLVVSVLMAEVLQTGLLRTIEISLRIAVVIMSPFYINYIETTQCIG